jgi:hypothetical protein
LLLTSCVTTRDLATYPDSSILAIGCAKVLDRLCGKPTGLFGTTWGEAALPIAACTDGNGLLS